MQQNNLEEQSDQGLVQTLREWWWVDGLAALFLLSVIIITRVFHSAALPAPTITPASTATLHSAPTFTPIPTNTLASSPTLPSLLTSTDTLVLPTAVPQPTTAPLNGLTLLQERCSVCHSVQRATGFSGNATQWKTIVDDMIRRGAQLSADEEQALINYLATTYP